MITYRKVPFNNGTGYESFRYLRNNVLTKESYVPAEVIEKFTYTDTVQYDDKPDERRCIFCDAPQSRQKYFNNETVDLCEWHYQNVNLGKIAQQVRLNKEEKERKEQDAINAKALKRLKTKGKQRKGAKSTLSGFVA